MLSAHDLMVIDEALSAAIEGETPRWDDEVYEAVRAKVEKILNSIRIVAETPSVFVALERADEPEGKA